MQSVLLIVLLLVTVAMVVVILLQRSEGGALGMGGGGGSGLGGLFTPRGAGDALSSTTAILAVVFFVTSLALTLLAVHGRPEKSFLDSTPAGSGHAFVLPKSAPRPAGPQVPSVPQPH